MDNTFPVRQAAEKSCIFCRPVVSVILDPETSSHTHSWISGVLPLTEQCQRNQFPIHVCKQPEMSLCLWWSLISVHQEKWCLSELSVSPLPISEVKVYIRQRFTSSLWEWWYLFDWLIIRLYSPGRNLRSAGQSCPRKELDSSCAIIRPWVNNSGDVQRLTSKVAIWACAPILDMTTNIEDWYYLMGW